MECLHTKVMKYHTKMRVKILQVQHNFDRLSVRYDKTKSEEDNGKVSCYK